jgi:glycosyltransferase involved in cell wall biosynthesis
MRFYTQPNKGPAAARNLALRFAVGEIIAFTDDDCLPHNDWLSTIVEAFRSNEIVGLQGRTYTDVVDITPLTHQIENIHGSKDVPTCNAAYKKDILVLLNGFDENFPYPHNEDADLAWRAEKLGTILFNKEMRVYHPPRTDRFKKVATRMKIMESEFRLFYKDPESYRKNRSGSLWKNIYWEVGVKTQWYYLKSRLKFLFRPVLMVKGLALTFIWWLDLIRSVPKFLKAAKINRQMFQSRAQHE